MNKTYKRFSTINKVFIGTVCFSLVTSQLYIARGEEPIDETDPKDDSGLEESVKSPITEPEPAEEAVIDEIESVGEGAAGLVGDTAANITADGTEDADADANPDAVDEVTSTEAQALSTLETETSTQDDEPEILVVSAKNGESTTFQLPSAGDTDSTFDMEQTNQFILNCAKYQEPAIVTGTLTWEFIDGKERIFIPQDSYKATLAIDIPDDWDIGGGTIISPAFKINEDMLTTVNNGHCIGHHLTFDVLYTVPHSYVKATLSGVEKPIQGNQIKQFNPSLSYTIPTAINDAETRVDNVWAGTSGSSTYQVGETYSFDLSITTKAGFEMEEGITLVGLENIMGIDVSQTSSSGDFTNGHEYNYTISYTVTGVKAFDGALSATLSPSNRPAVGATDKTARFNCTTDPDCIASNGITSTPWTGRFDQDHFIAGETYSSTITIKLNQNWMFPSNLKMKFNGEEFSQGAVTTSDNGNTYSYTVTYTIPSQTVESFNLRGADKVFKEGQTDKTLNLSINDAAKSAVDFGVSEWVGQFDPKKGSFVGGNTYKKTITLTTKDNYVFDSGFAFALPSDAEGLGYKLTKTTAAPILDGTGHYKLTFELSYKAEGLKSILTAMLDPIKAPVAGELPTPISTKLTPTMTTDGTDATLGLSPLSINSEWKGSLDEDGTFKAGTAYSFDIDIKTNADWRLANGFAIAVAALAVDNGESLDMQSLPAALDKAGLDPLEVLATGGNAMSADGFGAFTSKLMSAAGNARAIDAGFGCSKVAEPIINADNSASYKYRITYTVPRAAGDEPAPIIPPVSTSYISEVDLLELEAPTFEIGNREVVARLGGDGVDEALDGTAIRSKWEGNFDENGRFKRGETYKARIEIRTRPHWRLNEGVAFKIRAKDNTTELLSPLSIDPAAGLSQYRFGSLIANDLNDIVSPLAEKPKFTIKKLSGPVVAYDDSALYVFEISFTMPKAAQIAIPNEPTPLAPSIEPEPAVEAEAPERNDDVVGTLSETGDDAKTQAVTSLSIAAVTTVVIVEAAYRRKKGKQS